MPKDSRPLIEISTAEWAVVDSACLALANDPEIFQRGGRLVRISESSSSYKIEELPPATLRERLTRYGRFVRMKGDEESPSHPPDWCTAAVYHRGKWDGLRDLKGITEYPIVRPDGTILDKPGFDQATGFVLTRKVKTKVLDSEKDAIRAVSVLLELIEDFPVATPAHQSAWLAALLTPLARAAYDGPTPLFLADANCPASGKGLLFHVICAILTGRRMAIASYSNEEEELRKLITATIIQGDQLVLFDNLKGKFGNATLDKLLTGTIWRDRILGGMRLMNLPITSTFFATGNNVAIGADASRRIMPIRLESKVENPEDREDIRHKDIVSFVAANRYRYLSAALSVLSWFLKSKKQRPSLRAWGSYEAWSGMIRAALVAIGMPDPRDCCMEIRATMDITNSSLAELLRWWEAIDPDNAGLTTSEFMKRITDDFSTDCHEARELVEGLLHGKPTAANLGYKLRTIRRRILGGRYIDMAEKTGHHASRWIVRQADSISQQRE